ncbi:periplasmic chaperone for outer membrane proteins Skp [Spirosoma oryzae]|uniref:Periplasmic chaperone for outer membrane proteins Skp n=1 Tax=Spirosoma oryzae TaxID=1469603 RepID=A0A2T0SSY8_9BACT|nr:OmpH family outer membrane protein [Spirosoma oryzae]PRY36493.1 periplasmic chaperone for outer membrane proteins Skp [Spirosoma oryzae]
MNKTLVMAFAAALLAGGLNAQAQTTAAPATTASAALKLGYTNIDYILGQTPEAKDIQNQLTIQRTQSENELKRMQKELEDKYGAYQKGAEQMSDVIRKDRETELQGLQTRIQEFGRTAEQSLQAKYGQLVNPVVQKIQKAIDAVAQENGYTYIFNLDAGANTTPILLVAPKENDITDLVFKKLGVDPTKTAAPATSKPATTGAGSASTPAATPKKK